MFLYKMRRSDTGILLHSYWALDRITARKTVLLHVAGMFASSFQGMLKSNGSVLLNIETGRAGGHLPFEQGGFALLGICCDSLGNGDRWDVKWLSM